MSSSEHDHADDGAGLQQGAVVDGRYRLGRCIGRGGFARVFESEHLGLGRPAAVKVLEVPSRRAEAQLFVERFLREARLIARLKHPNVVSVYDFGVHEATGQPYLAMELLQGHDLERELGSHGVLLPARAQRLFLGALDALRAAHAAGVVHKDLKPSNLFIADPHTSEERLVLLDFGIALALDNDARITQAGGFTGTPAYVAPEYARHLQVSPAVDVYQMGLILSEALSGVPCVIGETSVQIILAHCSGQITIPDQVGASPFGPLVRRATALDPSARYHDGGDFAAALAQVAADDLPSLSASRARTAPARDTLVEHPDAAARTLDSGTNLAEVLRADAQAAVTRDVEPSVGAPTWTQPATTAPTQITTPPRFAWAVALAVVALVALVVAQVARSRPAPSPPAGAPKAVVAPVVAPVAIEPAIEVVEEEPTILLAEQPRFSIRSRPMGAVVYQGATRLGRTPFALRGDKVDGSAVELRFELDGHQPFARSVVLSDGGIVTAELAPLDEPDQGATPTGNFDEQNPQQMFELFGLEEMQRDYREHKLRQQRPAEF